MYIRILAPYTNCPRDKTLLLGESFIKRRRKRQRITSSSPSSLSGSLLWSCGSVYISEWIIWCYSESPRTATWKQLSDCGYYDKIMYCYWVEWILIHTYSCIFCMHIRILFLSRCFTADLLLTFNITNGERWGINLCWSIPSTRWCNPHPSSSDRFIMGSY